MTRKLHIFLTALLVATHALVVPWHIIVDHGVDYDHIGQVADELHFHAPAHAHASHHKEEPLRSASQVEVFDASGFGAPHHHDGIAHSVTEHAFSRSRADQVPLVLAYKLPAQGLFVFPAASEPGERHESPRPKATRLNATFLRGPPVS